MSKNERNEARRIRHEQEEIERFAKLEERRIGLPWNLPAGIPDEYMAMEDVLGEHQAKSVLDFMIAFKEATK